MEWVEADWQAECRDLPWGLLFSRGAACRVEDQYPPHLPQLSTAFHRPHQHSPAAPVRPCVGPCCASSLYASLSLRFTFTGQKFLVAPGKTCTSPATYSQKQVLFSGRFLTASIALYLVPFRKTRLSLYYFVCLYIHTSRPCHFTSFLYSIHLSSDLPSSALCTFPAYVFPQQRLAVMALLSCLRSCLVVVIISSH